MTGQKQPEELCDDLLDDVQGAGVFVGNPGKKGKGIIWADSTDGDGIRQPGTKQMERVYEDDE